MSNPNPSYDPENTREDDPFYDNVQEPFESRQEREESDAREANTN